MGQITENFSQAPETAKHVADVAAGAVVVATLMAWLPPIAALMTALYTGLRIYEWFEKRRRK